jgi:hypothetical protein
LRERNNNIKNKQEFTKERKMTMLFAKKRELIERISNNYLDFKASLRGVSRETLYCMASRIAAVTEVYEMLASDFAWGEDEVDFFLLFRDPLTIISDVWESHRNESLGEIEDAVFDAALDDRVISLYPLLEGVDSDIVYNGDPTEYRHRFTADI